jgi:hypothetical protein
VLRENKIYRTLYAIPELIEDLKLEDEVENCLKEALVVYDKER